MPRTGSRRAANAVSPTPMQGGSGCAAGDQLAQDSRDHATSHGQTGSSEAASACQAPVTAPGASSVAAVAPSTAGNSRTQKTGMANALTSGEISDTRPKTTA